MEASLKFSKKRREDFTPVFPAEGNFSEIVDLLAIEGGTTNDDECSDWDSGNEDVDEWSSSPYMDRLAKEVKSNGQFFKWFSISKGQRLQGKVMNSFDMDTVNTMFIFLAKGKLSIACKLFKIFTDMGLKAVYDTPMFALKGFHKLLISTRCIFLLESPIPK